MTQATDDVYYLYVGNGWSGPFRIEQIRLFVKEKQIASDTFAFEPQQQMQLTVAQLLADPKDAATGSYQSPTAPKEKPKSSRLDVYDAKQTVVSGRGPQTGAQKGSTTQRRDDEVIDLDAVSTTSTNATATRRQDDEVIDLDAAPTSVTNRPTTRRQDDDVIDLEPASTAATAKNRARDDDEVIDLDAPRKDRLSVEIDEPAGRPAESTVHGRVYQPQPGSQEALEVVLGELENLRRAYNALMENSIKDRQDGQSKVHVAHLAINEVLEERKADIAEIRSLVAEIDQVASELAKKHRDQTLSTRIIRLRDSLQESDVAQMVQGAEAVLRRIVEQFDRTAGIPVLKVEDPFAVFDAAESAPALANAQAQLSELRKAYDELHRQLTKEQQDARERVLSATALLENERGRKTEDLGDARALASEIYRLACELDPQWLPRELYNRVQSLYEELSKDQPDATAMTPAATDVLVGIVGQLKGRAEQPASAGDAPAETSSLRRQVKELGGLRAELLQTRTDLGVMKQREQALQEEKARLQQLLDEQKAISEKAQQAAKAREQRLRSTVCALEVTKELHQEVMRDLQTQLASAQGKVEEMEQDLRSVRGQLTSRREKGKQAGEDLNAEMRRVVEMRAMLDARKEELSADLKSTEAELQRVTSSDSEDQPLAEMLAAKVNHLRQTYEQTLKRLGDQEAKAVTLQSELDASRAEAGELRGRSDNLNSELENARSHLSSAKKRVEELHLAYQRLESERESLQQELTQRKSTTTVFRAGEEGEMLVASELADPSALLAEATLRAEGLASDLTRERRQVQDLSTAHDALQARVAELTADRDQLRAELERATEEHHTDHERHAAAVAAATQAAIEAETRHQRAVARIAELEQGAVPAGPAAGASTAGSSTEVEQLRRDLEQARQQGKAALALLSDARAAVAAATANGGNGGERIAGLAQRLDEAEKDISAAAGQRDQALAQLASAKAEAERLARELESAANEHRASLSSARNRLVQEQERSESLEREVADLSAQAQSSASQRESINVALAQAVSAKDRFAAEVERLRADIGSRSTASDLQGVELEAARTGLAEATERIRELEARLAAFEQTASRAKDRAADLEAKLARSQAERQQLLGELDRLRGELVTVAQTRADDDTKRADERALAAEAVASRRLLAESDAERERLRAQVRDANAELDRMRAELREIAEREATQGNALLDAESRLVVESTRWQAADKLLADARTQFHAVSNDRDRARIELAESEAQRKALEHQLDRLRGELERLKARAQGTEPDSMQSLADQKHMEKLEHELIDAHRKLKDLELRETQRLAMVTAERDELTLEVRNLRERGARQAAHGLTDSRLLESVASSARTGKPVAPVASDETSATAVSMKLEKVTLDFRRLEAQLDQLRTNPEATTKALETTCRKLARARRRMQALEGQRDIALTQDHAADPAERKPQLEHLRRLAASMQAGGTVPAIHPLGERDSGPLRALPYAERDYASTTRRREHAQRMPMDGDGPSDDGFSSPFTPKDQVAGGRAFALSSAEAAITARILAAAQRPDAPVNAALPTARTRPPRRRPIGTYIAAGAVSLVAIVLAMTAMILSALFPYSNKGLINAEVRVITSPIDGLVDPLKMSPGSSVQAGDPLTAVRNDHVDTSQLRSLQHLEADYTLRQQEADATLADEQRQLDRAEQQAKEEHARIDQELAAARAALADAKAAASSKELVLKTITSMAAASNLQLDTKALNDDAIAAAKAVEAQKEALDVLEDKLRAVLAGNTPIQREVSEGQERVEKLKSQLAILVEELGGVRKRIPLEEAAIAALREATILSPIDGSLWIRKIGSYQEVKTGSKLLEITDPATMMVEVLIENRHLDRVQVGDRVRIHVSGSPTLIEGRVHAVEQNPQPTTKTMAQPLNETRINCFRAIVKLDSDDHRPQLIGRGVEVVVISQNAGAFGQLFGNLFCSWKMD